MVSERLLVGIRISGALVHRLVNLLSFSLALYAGAKFYVKMVNSGPTQGNHIDSTCSIKRLTSVPLREVFCCHLVVTRFLKFFMLRKAKKVKVEKQEEK